MSNVIPTQAMETSSSPSDMTTINASMMPTFIPIRDEIDIPQRIIIGIILTVICIFGFCGNTLVIVAVFLSRKLRTTTNVYVVNLAVADLLSCMFQIWDVVGLWSLNGWPIADWICVISSAVSLICVAFTIIDLALIAVNRYHKVLYPMHLYQKIYSNRNVGIMVGAAWLYCTLVVCVPPSLGIGKLGYSFDLKTCASDESNPGNKFYTMLSTALIFPIPLVTLIFCYTKIFLFVRDHQKSITATRRKSSFRAQLDTDPTKPPKPDPQTVQITKNLLYVVVAFVVCFTPYALAVAVPPLSIARHWSGLLVMFNSSINPIIYGLKHPHFKEVFPYILRGQWRDIPELVGFMHRFKSEGSFERRGSSRGSLSRGSLSKTGETGFVSTMSRSQSPPPPPYSP
ncbi:melatonin receptor type 1A-like [Amphiura filiformis]|uniref:melatonin receptor type 1A-like n=1 Tax=Amphiura filiformis TaxID=82378 RepID=UPI003B228405